MQSSLKLVFMAGCAALLLMAVSGSSGASPPAWQGVEQTTSAYLLRPGGPPLPPAPANGPAGTRQTLPNSTLPFPGGGLCSIYNSEPGNPPRCSTSSAGERCSTEEGDLVGGCSATGDVPTAAAACSTLAHRSACSVLSVPLNFVEGHGCSVDDQTSSGNTNLYCSTFRLGFRQFCSAENPGPLHICSTFTTGGRCSVFNPGNGERGLCSIFFQGEKACSTFANGSQCSVLNSGNGVCSAFKQAFAFRCSALGGGNCSVINGPPTTPPCRRP